MPQGLVKRAGTWLLALAIVCAIASYGVERFGYELCHRGLPLEALTMGTPIVGTLAAIASLFSWQGPWFTVAKIAWLAINGYQLVLAFVIVMGVGIAPCG
jgi:hypothetical protein